MSLSRALLVPVLFAGSLVLAQHRPAVQRPVDPGSARLTTELPVSDITYEGGYFGEYPRIAAGPGQALVVWSNGAVRVDESGKPLDVLPLIHGRGYPEGPQDVAWSGTRYVVATTSLSGSDLTINLTEITTDGHVLPSVEIDHPFDPNVSVALGANGDQTLVAYSVRHNDGRFDVNALLVEAGAVVRRFTLATNTDLPFPGRVVASPYGFLVLWPRNYRFIDTSGNVAGGSLPQSSADAVWNGNAFMVAASDAGGLTMFPIYPNAVVGTSTVVHPAVPLRDVVNPAIAWNGEEYAVLWQEFIFAGRAGGSYDLYASRVSPSLSVVDESLLKKTIRFAVLRFVPRSDSDAIAAIGNAFIPVWGSGIPTSGGGVRTIYDSRLDVFEQNTQLLSRRAAAQQIEGLVVQDDSARVFWNQSNATLTSSIDGNGRRGSTSTLPVKNYAAFTPAGASAVAAWSEGTTGANAIVVTFINEGGQADAPKTLVQSPTFIAVNTISCNDNDCATVWRQYDENNSNERDFFQRFTFNGVMLGEPLQLAPGLIQLSGRGDEYLLVFRWADLVATRYADGKLSDVTDLQADAPYGVTIAASPGGWLVSAAQALIHLDSKAAIDWRAELPVTTSVSLAWDGYYWIAAWPQDGDIRAGRIRADGSIRDIFPAAATAETESHPVLRSNGNGLTALAYTRTTDDRVYGITSRAFVRWIDSR